MTQLAFIVACLHVLLCPFTKVEESFNIQAAHDIIFHRFNLSKYDHNEFPGVVPRTFIGSLVASAMAAPAAVSFYFSGIDKFWMQYIVRFTLAISVMGAWVRLRSTLKEQFGATFVWWYTIITVTQFHFMFYLSRLLPNMMVLPLVIMAFDSWMSGKYKKFIMCAGASIVIFRSELAILFGLFLIIDLYFKRINLASLMKLVVPIGIGLVLLTVVIDSIFWGRLLWPEAEVFWFNTIMNKSSQWGTSPFLWYFYSALPRGLGPSLVLVPIGAYLDKRLITYVAPAATYVLLYSFLPHKELRFVIYIFPLFNMAAAAACSYIYLRRNKKTVYELLFWGVILIIIGNICLTFTLVAVAMKNYPGGEAIMKLHRLLEDEPFVHVHVSNLAAQTGFTRFTEMNPNWKYSKNESLTPDQLQEYTHLIVEGKSKFSQSLKPFAQTHVILDSVTMFAQLGFTTRFFPPIRLKTRPALYILERKNFRDGPQGIGIPTENAQQDDSTSAQISAEDLSAIEEDSNENNVQKIDTNDIDTPGVINENDNYETDELESETPEISSEAEEQDIVNKKNKIDDLKVDWRLKRKQKAIEKIKAVTRKEVFASAKEKLREIMKRHKYNAQAKKDVSPEQDSSNDPAELTSLVSGTEILEEHTDASHILKNDSIEGIVEEVIVRLIDKKIFDDKSKPEDLTNEDRKVIHQVVEQVLVEKVEQVRLPEVAQNR